MEDDFITQMQGAAIGLHEMYQSFVDAGFNEDQALSILNSILAGKAAQQ